MMLRAAFVPPDEVVEDLRSLVGRMSALPGVRPLPGDQLEVPIAGLGNVTPEDARELARKIAAWPGPSALPRVSLSGVQLQPDGDVGVMLGGDLSGLFEIVGAVGTSAEKVHVYIDRRVFRPMVVVARVESQKPGSRVGSALARIENLVGATWTVEDVALVQIRWFAGQPVSEVLEFVPIAGAREVGTSVVESVESR